MNVKSFKGLGWCMLIDRQIGSGWVYRFRLILECGHEVMWNSATHENRVQNVSPPAWVKCKECDG